MRLIVGLGNPGKKYDKTRHNIGFEVVTEIARRFARGTSRQKFEGEQLELDVEGERCLAIKPLTFMNLSGSCVLPTRDFYKVANEAILVVCDDLSLPVGRIRLRAKGSSGGQKGLDDIIRRLGTDEVARLRIGIGAAPPGWDAADYVLSRFSADETATIQTTIERAADAVRDWVKQGIEYSMNKYNAA